jgi:Tfp pilus assembly protein PilO
MKLDLKSIFIIILLATTILFGYKWFFSGNKESKEIVKQLEKEFKELEKQKKSVDIDILQWRAKSDSLKTIDAKLKSELAKQEALTKAAEKEAKKSKDNLDKMRKDLEETRKNIEQIKNNPPNRTGDALLESLKNKTKR